MKLGLHLLLLIGCLPTLTTPMALDEAGIAEAEKDFSDSLGLVLSDLSAEVAAKNRTFITHKLAQIRNRKKTADVTETNGDSDVTSARIEKRRKRRKLRQNCLSMANRGSSKMIKKRVW